MIASVLGKFLLFNGGAYSPSDSDGDLTLITWVQVRGTENSHETVVGGKEVAMSLASEPVVVSGVWMIVMSGMGMVVSFGGLRRSEAKFVG